MWLPDVIRGFKAHLIARRGFREFVQKTPLIQYFARHDAARLFALATGFVHSQILVALLRSGAVAQLASGPTSSDDLAAHTGLPVARLESLLRAAAALDLVHVRRDARYALGPLGAALVDNEGLVAMILHHDALYADLAQPLDVLSDAAFTGRLRRFWQYANPAGEGDDVALYSRLMAASQDGVTAGILACVDRKASGRWLDVGGGNATFAMALARHCLHLSITVVDLPPVAELARERIAAAGLERRIDVHAADFFVDALPGGADAISLVRILHDHDDAPVQSLLRAAHAALSPGGRLLVAEPLADTSTAGRLLEAYFDMYLLAMGQGRLRRPAELRAQLTAAGFSDIRRRRTPIPLITSVIESRKVRTT